MNASAVLRAVVVVLAAGCQALPEDGTVVAIRSAPVTFLGVAGTPGAVVQVEAFDPVSQRFETIGETVSDSQPAAVVDGIALYPYTAILGIPERLWMAGASGHVAEVRARTGSSVNLALAPGGTECAQKADGWAEILERCVAMEPKLARVYTADYAEPEGLPWTADVDVRRQDLTWDVTITLVSLAPPQEVILTLWDAPVLGSCEMRSAHERSCVAGVNGSTHIPLVRDGQPTAFASMRRVSPDRRIWEIEITGIPAWKPGENRFSVAVKPRGPRSFTTHTVDGILEDWELRQLHRGKLGFHLDPQGVPYLEIPGLPAVAADCRHSVCVDGDRDGLLDAWENFALHLSRPLYEFDEKEDLFARSDHVLVGYGLVRPDPPDAGRPSRVIINAYLAHTRDYGSPAFHIQSHGGDKSSSAMELFIGSRSRPEGVRAELARLWTRGHIKRLRIDNQTYFVEPDVVELTSRDGAPVVYIEEDKHGTWWDGAACEERGTPRYNCFGSRPGSRVRPPAVNVGASVLRAFVDGIDDSAAWSESARGVRWNGTRWIVPPPGTSPFPGERVWTGLPDFCGGVACNEHSPGAIGPDLAGFDGGGAEGCPDEYYVLGVPVPGIALAGCQPEERIGRIVIP